MPPKALYKTTIFSCFHTLGVCKLGVIEELFTFLSTSHGKNLLEFHLVFIFECQCGPSGHSHVSNDFGEYTWF